MHTQPTLATLAGESYDWFTTKSRDDGTSYVVLKDGAPEWVQDLVRTAHGDFLSDDWRYASIRSALGALHDSPDQDPDDLASEWADGNVDIYTGDRLAWLGSNLQRTGYVDDAAADMGLPSPFSVVDVIGMGQYAESVEVFGLVLEALRDELESR